MTTLEADLDERAGGLVDAEQRGEQEGHQRDTHDVLAGGKGHTHGELRAGEIHDLLRLRQLLAEEEGAEDHGNQQAREGLPHGEGLGAEDAALGEAVRAQRRGDGTEDLRAEEESQEAREDGGREEQLLGPTPLDAHGLAQQDHHA